MLKKFFSVALAASLFALQIPTSIVNAEENNSNIKYVFPVKDMKDVKLKKIDRFYRTDGNDPRTLMKNLIMGTHIPNEAEPELTEKMILVNYSKLADGLAAGVLAGASDSAILFIDKDNISKDIMKYIKEGKPKSIKIVGGENSISKNLENKLKKLGYKTERIEGKDRYETAIKIGEIIRRYKKSNEIIFANGNSIADAAAATPLGSYKKVPILFTGTDSVPNVVKDAIKRWNIENVIAIGGSKTMPESILKSLDVKNILAINAPNRYDASVALYDLFYKYEKMSNPKDEPYGVSLLNGNHPEVGFAMESGKFIYTNGRELTPYAKYMLQKNQVTIFFPKGGEKMLSTKFLNSISSEIVE